MKKINWDKVNYRKLAELEGDHEISAGLDPLPADLREAAKKDHCVGGFHVFAGTAKPGDLCKCGKDIFLPELL
jgi:hypothetical protein